VDAGKEATEAVREDYSESEVRYHSIEDFISGSSDVSAYEVNCYFSDTLLVLNVHQEMSCLSVLSSSKICAKNAYVVPASGIATCAGTVVLVGCILRLCAIRVRETHNSSFEAPIRILSRREGKFVHGKCLCNPRISSKIVIL
jgi:hypothetical protein